MKLRSYILLMLLVPAFIACTKEQKRELPTFSDITLAPAKSVYVIGDTVQASVTMRTPGDETLKQATWWFYTSWWGDDADMTADFCEPDTVDGVVRFTSSKIGLSQAGEVKIYFWGKLEYPNWDFQPIQIPVTLHVQ